jgi:Sec-independent protein secretion pathway component TatC
VATVLPPDLNTTFVLALLIPLVLGFLVGVVIKNALKVGAAIALIVILLIFAGILTPSQVIQPVLSAVKSGPALTAKVKELAGYLPYSSVLFLIGVAVGFYK